MAQAHPTLREPQPKREHLRPVEPVLRAPPLWVPPPPRSRLADIAGRIRYFGFGILIVAGLAVLPLVLLLMPTAETDKLDEAELAALLAAEQTSPGAGARISEGVPAFEAQGIRLTVATDPGGASVLIDYESVGITPLLGHVLKPGVYVLSVRKEQYAPVDTVLFVDEQSVNSILSISLRPAGDLNDGAATNERVSTADAERVARQKKEAEEQRRREREARSEAAETERLNALQRRVVPPQRRVTEDRPAARTAQTPSTGTVTVLVRPWGSIYIDGTLRERDTDIQYSTTLPVGRHRIRVVHPTLGTRESEVQVSADQTLSIAFDLTENGGAENGN